MNVQIIIIGLLFIVALGYLFRKTIQPIFSKKSGCDKGCGCGGKEKKI
ncbi:FeoB-associated Cys-rich membrane protein [Ornithobacterium rhinotracheale]